MKRGTRPPQGGQLRGGSSGGRGTRGVGPGGCCTGAGGGSHQRNPPRQAWAVVLLTCGQVSLCLLAPTVHLLSKSCFKLSQAFIAGSEVAVGFSSPALCLGRAVLLSCGCLCNVGGEEEGKCLHSKQMGMFNTNGFI